MGDVRPPSERRSRKRLPRHYWPMAFVVMLIAMVFAAGFGVLVGMNPYLAALIGGCLWTLVEAWTLKRRGY